MKSNIITIMKKEFARFFKDKRMVLTTIFMPGFMIYVLYSFMGQGMGSMYESAEGFVPQAYVEHLPASIMTMQGSLPISFTAIENEQQVKEVQENLENGKATCDLLILFPEDFDQAVEAYEVQNNGKAPEIEIYYNSTSTDSQTAYAMMINVLQQYEETLANKFDVNSLEKKYDLASEKDTAGQIFSMLIPLLMMAFLFSGCMAVAPESIAGEKERGTIATLLVTPMNRSHLALGKIISLSVIAILSGLSSFLGTMLSIPSLMGDMEGVNASVYKLGDYILLLAVILSTVLVIISLISIISAYAKNVKEATTWVTPLMIVVMMLGITSMIDGLKASSGFMYMIPLYNSVQCMGGIFSFSIDMTNIIITIVSNVCFSAVFAYILTKMFDSEKIMFSK